MIEHTVSACVEAICNKGCVEVRRDIANLERGKDLPETSGLADSQRHQVLKELQAIMSVYGDSCRI